MQLQNLEPSSVLPNFFEFGENQLIIFGDLGSRVLTEKSAAINVDLNIDQLIFNSEACQRHQRKLQFSTS